jgi:methionyl-tRNA formyltransferase
VIVAVAATADVAIPTLEWLKKSKHQLLRVITTPDSRAGRGKVLTASPAALWADLHDLEVLKPNSVEEMEVAFQGADIVLAIAYGRILPSNLLEIPKHGFLNLHFSLLPAYRGAAPVQRSILNGDVVTGITIFKIDENLDTGPIYIQKEWNISKNTTCEQVLDELSIIGSKAFEDVLQMIEEGKAPSPQRESGVSFAPKVTKEEAKIDWNVPAKKITDLVRAFNPNPGAWTLHKGLILKITEAVEEITEQKLEPGVIRVAGKRLFIGTANNSVEIVKVIPAGKKEMMAADWINGARLIDGEVFE